ncbi:MAG TPA: type I-E CRISPR-associated endoribonuclease Cas2 [Bacteroidales bacterium]|jgi:CRISPR-associated protein Cas2|nr:type I-E CRISPR-associated endoribonuclease Cas2e [Syntrophaceticus schinkii]HHV03049.1 type I-E CRISPR-associated endoribonuclease Cas2 [Bacteroidales bacterium]
MIVITLTDCPPALRGDLTKWLQEINTGVYVGQVSARVRDELWKRVRENAKSGRATMVFSTNNEQRMDFRIHNTSWEPIDFDGLKLILRPSPARIKKLSELRTGFSKAARKRKSRQMSKRTHGSKPLPDTYIAVDVETTGLSATEHEMIEIGAIIVRKGQIEAKFHSLVKPTAKIPPAITALTGLSDEILEREGKKLADVLPAFLTFAGDLPVVSHNANFDYGFLRFACKHYGLPLFSNQCVDTLALARRLVNDVKNYKLATLLDYFGIEANSMHRSIDDCLTTKQLYEKLIELRQGKE